MKTADIAHLVKLAHQAGQAGISLDELIEKKETKMKELSQATPSSSTGVGHEKK